MKEGQKEAVSRAEKGAVLLSAPLMRPGTAEELIDLARQYGPMSIEALADEVRNGKGASRISAANALLERGWGKAGQHVDVNASMEHGIFVEHGISPEVAAFLAELGGGDASGKE